jgi:Arm DNA-binding domain
MPRPRRDGTPARSEPNRRKLSDAFVKVVKPDADRAIVWWDTLQRGLALKVEPTGHRSWKCVYTVRGRGARWYHLGDARAVLLADARRLAAKVMALVAEGSDPHADRLALRGRGSFEQAAARYLEVYAKRKNKSWKQAAALVAKHLLPRWGKLDSSRSVSSAVSAATFRSNSAVSAVSLLSAFSAAAICFAISARRALVPGMSAAAARRAKASAKASVIVGIPMR